MEGPSSKNVTRRSVRALLSELSVVRQGGVCWQVRIDAKMSDRLLQPKAD